MIERRNFYRILHIQPDASIAVIKESYRVLMRTYKKHSDGDAVNWDTSLLSIAYKTLQDARLRAAYDRELLKRYHIKALSQGAFGIDSEHPACQASDRRSSQRNRRNYYRILQVQPDAPNGTIAASYRVLKQSRQHDGALLDEAYRILSNPAARQQYDTVFSSYTLRGKKKSVVISSELPALSNSVSHAPKFALDSYQANSFNYCLFCDTPYVPRTGLYQHETCLECESPLHALPHGNLESSRRLLRRIHIKGEFSFYLFWPSEPYLGIFQDLSPAGIRFATNAILDPKDIIKIDAPNFQAVAEVTHRQDDETGLSVGTRFIAVKFDQQQGNFVTAQA